MTTVDAVPSAVHRGDGELPWVDAGGGTLIRVLHVSEARELFIIENLLSADTQSPTHRHTGPVWGYTQAGAWEYLENDFVNRAGSFLYEPAGSVHTLHAIEEGTRAWFQIYGSILNLDADGVVERVIDAPTILTAYRELCEANGLPAPNVVVD
jgi:quercetin dioxygenase-like cupin family protein